MYTNVNLAAPVGALAFMVTGLLLLVVAATLVYSVIKRKSWLRKLAVVTMALVSVLYLAVLLIFSLASSEKLIARGEEKHFCEIDCHLAYSVADARQTKTLGDGPNQLTAGGLFHVISIKTRFDENTISRHRGNGPLTPNSRVVSIVDEQGNEYFSATAGQLFLENSQAAGTPITTKLRPGENYSTTFVFDLPADIRNPALSIREGELVTHFVIGHENSLLHKKTRFQI